tara:strand:- start:645 stop:4514 length:3870 start_codon:yes stop_codon:yes gene_type:complete
MNTENLITKNAFYESDVFQKIAAEAGVDTYLDSEGEINSRYRDNQGNLRSYTPRQILESGGPRANVVQEVETDQGRKKIALSNADFFQFAATLEQVLNDPARLEQVSNELGVDATKLQSDYEAIKPVYDQMWSRIGSNNNRALVTSDYERREQDEERLVPPVLQTMGGALGYALSEGAEMLRGAFFDSNEDQREALTLRGINPRYIENSYEEFAPIDSDYFYRIGVSPVFSTPTEYKNIIRKFDPDAQVEYINPQNPEAGLIIKSEFNPFDEERGDRAWLPVANVQPMESMLEGDVSPALRELSKFGAQEGGGIVAGGGLVALAGNVARRKIKDRLQRKATDIDTGEVRYQLPESSLAQAATEVGFTALGTASVEAVNRLGMLALGTTEAGGNVQPNLQFERAMSDSGAIFQAALLYGAGGDALIRGAGAMWGKLTGRPVSSEIIDTMMVEARVLGDKIRRINDGNADALPEETTAEMQRRIAEVIESNLDTIDPKTRKAIQIEDALPGGGATRTRDATFEELSPADILRFTQDGSTKAANRLKERMQTLGQMSQNEQILAFEELISEIALESPIAGRLEDLHRQNASALEQFYRDILRKANLDPREAEDLGITKETLNNVFSGIRSQKLVQDLSEEERVLAETMADQQLGQLFTLDTSRTGRQEAAKNIQEQVNTAQSQAFPDQKSRIVVQRSEELDGIRSQIDGVLSRDLYNDSRATKKLPKYISESLEDFLNANKQEGIVFGSEDTAEAAEFIRAILPNRETEGISIQLLLGQGRDKGQFLPQRDFTQRELILTRENLSAAISGHPNKVIRDKGQALLDNIDRAIDDNFRQMYKLQTGRQAPESMDKVYDEVGREYQILATRLADRQRDLSARFLVDLAKKDESEIGAFVRTSNPSQVRSLVDFISKQEGGLEKLQSIKSVVLESIQRELDVENAGVSTANNRFNKILSQNEEQLRALFPEEFVKFENYRGFLDNAKESISKSKASIRDINNELAKLADDTGTTPTLTQALDNYFGLSVEGTANIRETQLGRFVNTVGKMAEENPELRTALQEYFAENIVLGLRGTKFRTTKPKLRMLEAAGPESAFNLNRLTDLFLTPFNTDAEAARFLEPIVGADEAFRYAKDLRILARMINRQKGFAGNPLETYIGKSAKDISDLRDRGPRGRGFIDRARRAIFGPLDLTATRIGIARDVFAEELDNAKTRYLADIVSDPTKLRAYLKAEELKLPALVMYQMTAQIAAGRESNLGSEENQTARDRLIDELANLTEEQDTPKERILRMLEEIDL